MEAQMTPFKGTLVPERQENCQVPCSLGGAYGLHYVGCKRAKHWQVQVQAPKPLHL